MERRKFLAGSIALSVSVGPAYSQDSGIFNFFKKQKDPASNSVLDNMTLNQVFPRIKSDVFAKGPAASTGPIKHLVADLYVIYAFEGSSVFMTLTHEDVAGFGLSEEELHNIAIENFRKRIPEVQLHRYGDFYVVQTGYNYEASMLVDYNFWQQEAEDFGGPLVAGAPHRDHLMFCDSANKDALSGLIEFTQQTYADVADNHSLSSNLIEWTAEGWKVFDYSER